MVQVINKQGDIFGRVGAGIGQGLAEQLPKEIERGRLSEGLRQFAQDSPNLNQIEQLARLSAIPGITPQAIQTFGELSRQQNIRNEYGRNRRRGNEKFEVPSATQQFQEQTGNLGIGRAASPANAPSAQAGETPYGQTPQIVERNPTASEFKTLPPWSSERREDEIGDYFYNHPNGNLQDALAFVQDKEARELAIPEVNQKEYERLRKVQEDARDEFKNQLETKLQKTKEGVFEDITGENLINLRKGMERDIRLNPNANVNEIADRWSTKALELSKTKNQLKALAQRSIIDQISPDKRKEDFKKLKNYSKIFKETGNSEEFYNTLQSSFSMSPQGAALIAYPSSKGVSSFIDSIKANKPAVLRIRKENSRKYAEDVKDKLTGNDSILSIAKQIMMKDPTFDQQAFFDELREDDNLRLNPRQKRELSAGVSDITPTWGDFWLLP